MSQAFWVFLPCGYHIHRLMYRWNLTSGKMSQTEKTQRQFLRENYGMICTWVNYWYGREYCQARGWNSDNGYANRWSCGDQVEGIKKNPVS
jgi:endonuclease-3